MSILVLTDVQIANEALKRLGLSNGFVTAVDGSDTSKNGKLIYPTFQRTRDAELRSNDWAQVRKRAELTLAQVTLQNCAWTAGSDIVTVPSSAGIVVGWVLGAEAIQGNPPAIPPVGIPQGTTVLSIPAGGTTVQMSANATVNGSGQIVFQVDNETGFWFAYILPDDALRLTDVYAVYPASSYLYPYKTIHTLSYPFVCEDGYIYTDIFTNTGTAIAEYIFEPTADAIPSGMDFIDSLILRIASEICVAVTGNLNLKKDIDAEYIATLQRAFGTSKREEANANLGEPWCR